MGHFSVLFLQSPVRSSHGTTPVPVVQYLQECKINVCDSNCHSQAHSNRPGNEATERQSVHVITVHSVHVVIIVHRVHACGYYSTQCACGYIVHRVCMWLL